MAYGIVRISKNELLCDSVTNRPIVFADKNSAWKKIDEYDRKGTDLIVVNIEEWEKLLRDSILDPDVAILVQV